MSNPRVVFLTDGVVTLRPVFKTDLPFLLSCANDPSVRQYIGRYLPQLEADEEEWLIRMSKNKQTDIVFAIEVEGAMIGIMGIHKINWKDRTGDTGAMIRDSELRGKGYGTRAKMMVLDYAFHELNLRKICSAAIAFNVASLRFNEKCGYKEEGRRRKQVWKNGEYHDLVLTAVFQEDFEPLWKVHKEKHGIAI